MTSPTSEGRRGRAAPSRRSASSRGPDEWVHRESLPCVRGAPVQAPGIRDATHPTVRSGALDGRAGRGAPRSRGARQDDSRAEPASASPDRRTTSRSAPAPIARPQHRWRGSLRRDEPVGVADIRRDPSRPGRSRSGTSWRLMNFHRLPFNSQTSRSRRPYPSGSERPSRGPRSCRLPVRCSRLLASGPMYSTGLPGSTVSGVSIPM